MQPHENTWRDQYWLCNLPPVESQTPNSTGKARNDGTPMDDDCRNKHTTSNSRSEFLNPRAQGFQPRQLINKGPISIHINSCYLPS